MPTCRVRFPPVCSVRSCIKAKSAWRRAGSKSQTRDTGNGRQQRDGRAGGCRLVACGSRRCARFVPVSRPNLHGVEPDLDRKRVTLEMGGNNAMVVLEDADLSRAVPAGVLGSFLYQGQICMASSRI